MKRFDWRGLSGWGKPGGRGVGVLIKDDWTVADEVSLSSKGIESIWVSVGNKGVADTLLGVVYFTPHCGREVFDKGAKIIDFVLEKQQEGLKVVLRVTLMHTLMRIGWHRITKLVFYPTCLKWQDCR